MRLEVIDKSRPETVAVRKGGVLEGATNQYSQGIRDWAIVAFNIMEDYAILRGRTIRRGIINIGDRV
jgi:hypothetical protein